jgi:neurotransmitter:Na+ symporter, NSS family
MDYKEQGKRDGFTSKFGIIAAAAGSAIGLGNIWRFPYVVGENGGGAFLLVYLSFVLLLGIPVMLSEFVIGRKAKRNAFGAFRSLAPGTGWPIIGIMGIVAAFVILAFYSTIAGWTLHYIYLSVINAFKGSNTQALSEMFGQFMTSNTMPLFWQMVFLILTAVIILSGVKKGIEKYSKILMPFLLVLLIALCIRSLTLPGATQGLAFLFKPDFSKINPSVILSALGQAAFSLSIGMGALITYASYFPKNTNLTMTAFEVSIADVLIAVLAGIAIFPAVFALGMQPDGGVGLIFMVLPNVFQQMTGGYFIAIAFFVLLAIAALTSSISIMEVVVAFLAEEFSFTRKKATIITLLASAFVGFFCTLSWSTFENVTFFGKNIFDSLDFTASNVLLPLGGLLIVLFVGWYMPNIQVKEELSNQGVLKVKLFAIFTFLIRFVAPIAISIVFLNGIGVIKTI